MGISLGSAIGFATGGLTGAAVGWGYDQLKRNNDQNAAGTAAYNKAAGELAAAQAEQVRQATAYAKAENDRAEARQRAWEAQERKRIADETEAARIAAEKATKTKNQLKAQSSDFDKNMNSYAANQSAMDDTSSIQEMNQGLTKIGNNADDRGLMFSGINQGAQSALRSNNAADMAANRVKTNQQIGAQGDLYRNLASDGTRENEDQLTNNYNNQVSATQNAYNTGLQSRRKKLNRTNGINSLYNQQTNFASQVQGNEAPTDAGYMPGAFQAIGNVGGAIAGSTGKKKAV